MRTSLLIALLLASAAPAAPTAGAAKPAGAAARPAEVDPIPVQPPAYEPQDGEEGEPLDEDAPLAPPPADEGAAPLEALPSGIEPLPVADPESQRLVSGAPLRNPNVAVHVVQKKRFADGGKHEAVFFPGVAQLNGKFTQHMGTGLEYVYHLQENFALKLTGLYNWRANESGFTRELIDNTLRQPQTATSLLLQWGALAGAEVTPFYGKFALGEGTLGSFSLVLSGGAGVGSTRHLLRPTVNGDQGTIPARFVDTGTRFLGSIGGGVRVQFGSRFALRMEVRDLVYTANVDRVNGCNLADFQALDEARAAGLPFAGAGASSGCRFQSFEGVDSRGKDLSEDIRLGRDLVAEPSSDVLNMVSFFAGFSFLFGGP
jgi:outer membrane beta-barrel protein